MHKIKMYDIQHRIETTGKYPCLDMDLGMVRENAPINKAIFEKALSSWKELSYSEPLALSEMFDIMDKSSFSESYLKDRFVDVILPQVSHIRECEKLIKESYPNDKDIEFEIKKIKNIDRVIANQNILESRFDISGIQSNTIRCTEAEECTIADLCTKIDSLNIKTGTKYIVSLENVFFTMAKRSIAHMSDKEVLESVVNYYLTNYNTSTNIKYLKKAINETLIYDDDDKKDCLDCIDTSFDSDVEDSIEDDNPGTGLYDISESLDFIQDIWTEALDKSGYIKEKDTIKHILDSLKTIPKPSREQAKSLITKFYAKNQDQIVSDIPNILAWVRGFVVAATTIVNPVVGIIAVIIDQWISFGIKRKETDKLIEKLKDEISSNKTKIATAKNDKQRENLKVYGEELSSSLSKIEDYASSLYTDKENDERDSSFDDIEDFDNDFGSFNIESYDIRRMAQLQYLAEQIKEYNKNIQPTVSISVALNTIGCDLGSSLLESIIDLQNSSPNILDKPNMTRILKNVDRSTRGKRVDRHFMTTIDESYNQLIDSTDITSIQECMLEVAKAVEYSKVLQEISFIHTVNMIKDKLKDATEKLSDKDKKISKQLDYAVDNFNSKLKTEMTNKNREAVIKGTILPSASAALKICFAGAVASWLINPAIGIIGILGSLGASAACTNKERQQILDEINIQLQVVEKKMSTSENEGDMAAYEELLKAQQKLKKEKARLMYKLKGKTVIVGQNKD